MQPYFFPYIGYFQLINAVDIYVIADDLHFKKIALLRRICKKHTKPATPRVCIRPVKTLDIRPLYAKMVLQKISLNRWPDVNAFGGRFERYTHSKVMHVSMRKIDHVKKNFVLDGLDVTLNGHTRDRVY